LALRRISFGNAAKVKLKCPSGATSCASSNLVVFLMSDSYIGLDQEIKIGSDTIIDEDSSDEFDEDDDTFWALPPDSTEPFWLGEGENTLLT
jgi:activating signal cointegrator complex subunit 3